MDHRKCTYRQCQRRGEQRKISIKCAGEFCVNEVGIEAMEMDGLVSGDTDPWIFWRSKGRPSLVFIRNETCEGPLRASHEKVDGFPLLDLRNWEFN
ncbi:hypothetical protein VNO77_01678 [Canavalia gladiata]|uniref:Uncharacterized protein n=1 Tax=Canavalia gladiata TaxID=3824 RepID=A0AAN9MRN8_CANGL